MKLQRLNIETSTVILSLLLFLFIMRVTGQLLVANNLAPYLPPMHQWQSGLLPYPALVFFQIVIIIVYGKVCADLNAKQGFFYRIQPKVRQKLNLIGVFYFTSMIFRYIIYMAHVPESRWLSGTIPIVFHMVLASFIILYANIKISP